jgi:hypothetical protein
MRIEETLTKRGYLVTEDGLLLNPKGHKIGNIDKQGYVQSSIRIDKKSAVFYAHRLQAFQKYGDKLFIDGVVTRHVNGNSLDNSWNNIAIGSHSENMMDIPEQIRIKKAKHASSFIKKYNDDEVIDFYNTCKSYKKTMDKFGISSKGTLNYILKKNSQVA